ncbi:MAG TPA: hypothetical protein EYN26_05155 [Chromatiales bacterium]|jgi:hypothetical protein|nr:hypothetical protein [Chromatiaceae bacterium]HIO14251.1 hypothetical protein [Chromatiales bacterium]HIO54514.1 hypothetical protein [Chromatiales bacterium]
MYNTDSDPSASMRSFRLDGKMIRYSAFVPKLYNMCKSLGFTQGKILPSRALCSDESQGYPIILIAKHFNVFPFNHGRVGGIVATDRHGPHAEHGQDLVIIQASHVGYDPEGGVYGSYTRLQTHGCQSTSNCGKVDAVLSWYIHEYEFARNHIMVSRDNNEWLVMIDNLYLDDRREQGLFLALEKLIGLNDQGKPELLYTCSTANCFRASAEFAAVLEKTPPTSTTAQPIGDFLSADKFFFRRPVNTTEEGHEHLENNLLPVMSWILTSPSPLLAAAKVNTQVEFDRTYRSIIHEPSYRNKRLLLISGLNIDISPKPGQLFPLTKFIPWAAYLQQPDSDYQIYEQDDLYSKLMEQSAENPDQTDLEAAIRVMMDTEEVILPSEYS